MPTYKGRRGVLGRAVFQVGFSLLVLRTVSAAATGVPRRPAAFPPFRWQAVYKVLVRGVSRTARNEQKGKGEVVSGPRRLAFVIESGGKEVFRLRAL